jgi:hypothetical protein
MVLSETVSGKDFERNVGAMILVDIAPAAANTRSGSTRIFGRFGTMEASLWTTSAAPSPEPIAVLRRDSSDREDRSDAPLDDEVNSVNVIGRVVNRAARSFRNKSYPIRLVLGRAKGKLLSSMDV